MEKPLNIVLIEDDSLIVQVFQTYTERARISVFNDLSAFLSSNEKPKDADLFFVDLCSKNDPRGESAVRSLSELRRLYPSAEIVVESGLSDPSIMRACIAQGAARFVLKDYLADEIPVMLERLSEENRLKSRVDEVISGQSEIMRSFKRELLRVLSAPSMDVLVEGETGTGKELCAKALCSSSERPFVAVNVAAIPAELFEAEFFGALKGAYSGAHQSRMGLFEKASDGILFLDEIQSLSLEHQAKLLRVLETRRFRRVGSTQELEFKGRVVSATNQNLREMAARGSFREDLYFRLSSLKLQLPPLRVRSGDIALLAKTFLSEESNSKRFSESALEALESYYDWPGNVRELRSFVRELAVKSSIPILDDTAVREALDRSESEELFGENQKEGSSTFSFQAGIGFDESVAGFEEQLLKEYLSKFSSKEARERLKMSRSRFYEKIKIYGLGKSKPEAQA
ncbi:sigma-54-dependent Fis family transcriptional regulator [bacterium]|nr:sigma-54-dependent Fis family transcriptional regulator [bacterium]